MDKLTDKFQDAVNVIYSFIPQTKPKQEKLERVKLVAHRGSWNNIDRLENTFSAFDHCLDKKIWAIEFDIRWTKDNVPIVHHDASTKRVFNKDKIIAELTLAEIQSELPQIPSLEQIIKRYSKKLHLMIEIKTQLTPQQIEILKSVLSPLNPILDYHLMSLNLNHFKDLSSFNSKTFVSIARTNIKDIYLKSLHENFGGLTGHFILLSDSIKTQCLKKDIQVGTGFPTSKNAFYREVNRGINWIYTDHAATLSELI